MKKAIIVFSLVIIALGSSALAQTPCDDLSRYPVRFAILGDRAGDAQKGVYESIVAEIERMRPDFVMTVGDMIEGPIADTVEMQKRWDEYFAIVKPLTMPIHYTPGNNDIDITSAAMEPVYRARVGEPYYSFDQRGIHFVVLDNSRTEDAGAMAEEQINWLRDDLTKNRNACYTLVFFHKPFWYRTLGDGQSDALHDIFKVNGVDAVFSGHFHTYFSAEFDGILYTALGSSGGGTEESPDGLLYHFGWVTIDGGGVHITPIKKDAVLPWNVQTLAEVRAVSLVQSSGISFAQPLLLTDALTPTAGSVDVALRSYILTEWADTLRWQVPEGWTITPPTYPFTLAGGATMTAQFTIKPAAKLYPLPEISTRLPYAEGKSTRVSRGLEVARTARCVRREGQIVIDGQLTEACWTRPVTTLYNRNGTPSTQDSTKLYFAWDGGSLYVGAYCYDPEMDSIRATMTERDAAVYTEDVVGWLIQPGGKNNAAVAQVYVNPLGTVYDQLIERASDGYWSSRENWNGDYEVKAVRGADYYSVEMRIPLVQFGVAAEPSDRWRVNCRRKQVRTNSSATFQPRWSYDPADLGELVFE